MPTQDSHYYQHSSIDYWHPDPRYDLDSIVSVNMHVADVQLFSGAGVDVVRTGRFGGRHG